MRDSYLEIQIIVDMAFFNTKQAIENITNLQKLQKCCIQMNMSWVYAKRVG